MKRWQSVALGLGGLAMAVIPLLLYAQIAAIAEAALGQEDSEVLVAYTTGAMILKWVFVALGVGMIATAALGALHGHHRDPRM